MSKKAITIILLICLAGASAYYFLRPQAPEAPPAPPPVGVRTAEVSSMALPQQATSFGSLYAKHDAKLRSEIAGIVKVVNRPSGAKVAAGDVLLSFDSQAQLASLQKAKSAASLHATEYKRVQTLVAEKVLPRRDLDTKKNALDAAQAELDVAIDAFAKTTIKAPFAGKLGIWQVNEGDFVPAGTKLVELVDNRVLRVRYNLPERYLSRLALDQEIQLSSSAYPDQKFIGRVTVISPMVDPDSRNIELEAEINNDQALLYPGSSAEVIQNLGVIDGGIAVPEETVTYSIEGAAVYRVIAGEGKDSNKVERVVVQAGMPVDGLVPIIKGLAAGDQVVTEGVQKIRDGQEVQVLPAEASDPSQQKDGAKANGDPKVNGGKEGK